MISRTMHTIAALSGLALSACVVSVNPVIAPPDATFDDRLLGTWQEVGGSDRAVVSRGTEGRYAIAYTIDGETLRLDGQLGRLGERTVLDVWPVPRQRELPTEYAPLLLPAHFAVVLDIRDRAIAMSFPLPDSLLARMHQSTRGSEVSASARLVEGRLVLHGSTAELRGILGPYLASRGPLSQPSLFRRVADRAPAP